MHFNSLLLASVVGLASTVLGAPPEPRGENAQCYTTMTDRPAPYKTYWTTKHAHCTKTQTNTKTSTTTLPRSTSTITTTTTVTASTSTLTDTETDTTTSTATTTTTETSTTTTTSTAGFLPVQSTLPDSSYSGSGGAVSKRDPAIEADVLGVGINIGGTSPKQYPKRVECYKVKHGHCVKHVTTVKTTTTVTPRPVKTTTTQTDTSYPSATTTITTTSTAVTTSTETQTVTSTQTITVSNTPNCDPNNFADMVGDQNIFGASSTSTNVLVQTGSNSVLGCCQDGLLRDDGEIFVYIPQNTAGLRCFLFVDPSGTCPSDQTSHQFVTSTSDGGPQSPLGNLACGEVTRVV